MKPVVSCEGTGHYALKNLKTHDDMAPSDDTQAQLESIKTRLLQLAEDLLMDQIKEDEYAFSLLGE